MKPRYCPVCGAKMIVEGKELACRDCGFTISIKKPKKIHVKVEEK